MTENIGFWWRDDDYTKPTPFFSNLMNLREELDIPLSLAVVPFGLDQLHSNPHFQEDVEVLQHGIAHHNWGTDERKIELIKGPQTLKKLQEGYKILESFYLKSFVPVLVPPWNRIDERLIPHLQELGFKGLSSFANQYTNFNGLLPILNTHLDVMDWKTKQMKSLDVLEHEYNDLIHIGHKFIGILTHHLVMQPEDFEVLKVFLSLLKKSGNFYSAKYILNS
jgi:hypothetical protein